MDVNIYVLSCVLAIENNNNCIVYNLFVSFISHELFLFTSKTLVPITKQTFGMWKQNRVVSLVEKADENLGFIFKR